MDLPRSLTPWASLLSLFPDELVEALAPLVQRLDLAVGPMQADSRIGLGEPNGFKGLSRRGTYERLLLSEWLLADEVPEEFLRRAAMGEHAFLQPAQIAPAGGRCSVALFDAGPGQLGSPRLVHLAALLVLARRAEAAGAQFAWGIAQKPDAHPLSVVSEATVRELLTARTARSLTARDLEQWQQAIGRRSDVDDFWLVGTLPSGGAAMASLQIEDVLDPAVRQVCVTVCRPGWTGCEVRLDLPGDAVCTRLLRDPFDTPPPVFLRSADSRFAPASNLLFAPGGTKLLARAADGGLLAYPVPNSPHGGGGKPKSYRCPAVDPVFAAGRFQKAYVLLTGVAKGGRVRVDGVGPNTHRVPQGFIDVPSDFALGVLTAGTALRPCFPLMHRSGPEIDLFTTDAGGTLFRFMQLKSPPEATLPYSSRIEERNVSALALMRCGHRLVSISRKSEHWLLASRHPHSESQDEQTSGHDGEGAVHAFLGYGGEWEHQDFGLAAVQKSMRVWAIFGKQGEQIFTVPPDVTVVGVLGMTGKFGPGLLVQEPDGRRLTWRGQSWTQELPPASGRIQSVAVSTDMPNVAYATEGGEVVVFSLFHNAILYRLLPKEAQ